MIKQISNASYIHPLDVGLDLGFLCLRSSGEALSRHGSNPLRIQIRRKPPLCWIDCGIAFRPLMRNSVCIMTCSTWRSMIRCMSGILPIPWSSESPLFMRYMAIGINYWSLITIWDVSTGIWTMLRKRWSISKRHWMWREIRESTDYCPMSIRRWGCFMIIRMYMKRRSVCMRKRLSINYWKEIVLVCLLCWEILPGYMIWSIRMTVRFSIFKKRQL